MFMTMDYNITNDTTALMPMKLDVYSQPITYYKSDNSILGEKYKLATEETGGKATDVSKYRNTSDGNIQ